MKLELAQPGTLKGKRILITGGGSGFGRAMALAFAAEGALVAVCGRRKEKLDAVVGESGGKIEGYQVDVREQSQVEALFWVLREKWKGLDVLVNNAGVSHIGKLADYPLDKWQETMRTNLTGVFLMTREAVKLMDESGRIVNITSTLGFVPLTGYSAYCVSKAALNMLSKAFAQELTGTGILVNSVEPGVGKTEMNPEAATPPESIASIVRTLASLPPGGPSGQIFKKSGNEVALEPVTG